MELSKWKAYGVPNSAILLTALFILPNPVGRRKLIRTYQELCSSFFDEDNDRRTLYFSLSCSLNNLRLGGLVRHKDYNSWEITKWGINRLRYIDIMRGFPQELSDFLRGEGLHDHYNPHIDGYRWNIERCNRCNEVTRVVKQEHDKDDAEIVYLHR